MQPRKGAWVGVVEGAGIPKAPHLENVFSWTIILTALSKTSQRGSVTCDRDMPVIYA